MSAVDWGEIAEREWPQLVGYARYQRSPEPEDAVIEAFVRVIEADANPHGPSSWLRGIIRRVAVEQRRTAGRARDYLERHADTIVSNDDPTFLVSMKRCKFQSHRWTKQATCKCGRLFRPTASLGGYTKHCSISCGATGKVRHDPAFRARIAMMYRSNLSAREIARLVGLAPSSVYKHLDAVGVPRAHPNVRSAA